MRRLLLSLLILASTLSLPLQAQTPAQADAQAEVPEEAVTAPRLSARNAVALGLVEGITEFLPISSTGHLIITNNLLELESEEPIMDAEGAPLWHKKPSPKHPEGVPLTMKLAADTYAVIIQVGAIGAVVFLYWSRLWGIVLGLLGRNREGLLLLRNLVCAIVPVAAIGLACSDWIDAHLFSIQAVVVALVSGAVLMFYAERWRKQRTNTFTSNKELSELTAVEATGIGFIQCLALWPGTSRSMVTIVGGYFAGLSPARAAEFSFLVGLPVLGGAALIKGLKSGPAMIEVFGWDNVILGIVVAAVSGGIAVKSLVAILSRFGLNSFAIYRLLLACLLGWYFFL